ncbi:hypothetical protein ACFSHQ_27260 [Gemmobacter lanyuensis]
MRIETDTGIEGWGESTPFGSTYIASHAKGARAGSRRLRPICWGVIPGRWTASMTPWMRRWSATITRRPPSTSLVGMPLANR